MILNAIEVYTKKYVSKAVKSNSVGMKWVFVPTLLEPQPRMDSYDKRVT